MAKNNNKPSLKNILSIIGVAVLIIAILTVAVINLFGTSARDFTIEDGVITAYSGNKSTVRIPDGATSIGEFVFRDHTEIKKMVVGKNILTINKGAFYGCTNLKELKLASEVAYIDDGVVGECTSLESFTVPRDCLYLNSGAFYNNTGIKEFKVEKGNTVFAAVDGVLYLEDLSAIVAYPMAKTETEFAIPDSVEFVAAWCFYGNTVLKNITIPESVNEIGDYAFAQTAIEKVLIPDTVTEIGTSAFGGCESLAELKIGTGIETIPSTCFTGAAITELTIPENVNTIKESAFEYCPNLGNVTFEGDITTIDTNSFGNIPNLVLCGAEGSNLQNYAESCGYAFNAIR